MHNLYENQQKQQYKTQKKKSILNEITAERAYKIFLLSWEDEGYSPRYFLTIGEAKVILDTLEIQFKEELTKWLFNSANQVEIIHDLEKIINRGRPAASDNINSIRAFSFISILLKKDQFDFIETREDEQAEESFKSIAD